MGGCVCTLAFIVMHEKFGNQLQWLEPLLAATLITPVQPCRWVRA